MKETYTVDATMGDVLHNGPHRLFTTGSLQPDTYIFMPTSIGRQITISSSPIPGVGPQSPSESTKRWKGEDRKPVDRMK